MFLLDRFRKKQKKEKEEKKEEKLVTRTDTGLEVKPSAKEPTKKTAKKIVGKQAEWVYQIIKEPRITEKASFLGEQNKYVFKIYPKANKTEIKKAVEALYQVKVEKVHIIHSAAKKRRLGRTEGWRQGLKRGFKKAVVTLAKEDKIELLPR